MPAVQAVFVNANGYADGDEEGRELQRRLTTIARQRNVAVAGPNNLGLVNVLDSKAMWTPRYFSPIAAGPVAVISQSGSVALILSEDERKLGFSYLVTTGNEAVVTVADYLRHIAADDRVGVILLFLETIRDPALFAQAAETALASGKRIVALKLGRSAIGRALGASPYRQPRRRASAVSGVFPRSRDPRGERSRRDAGNRHSAGREPGTSADAPLRTR